MSFDSYGTIVHEDGVVIDKITTILSNTEGGAKKPAVGSYWWQIFQESYANSFGDSFKPQKELEIESLEMTLKKFGSDANDVMAAIHYHSLTPLRYLQAKMQRRINHGLNYLKRL